MVYNIVVYDDNNYINENYDTYKLNLHTCGED